VGGFSASDCAKIQALCAKGQTRRIGHPL